MKKIFLALSFIVSLSFAKAQDLDLPKEGVKEGEFSDWKKVELDFSGTPGTYEYRIAFDGKNAMACNYLVEIKNTSSFSLDFAILYSYDDKLVKRHMTESKGGKIKPGKVLQAKLIQQGVKKEKGVERSDLGNCLACGFGYEIKAVKK